MIQAIGLTSAPRRSEPPAVEELTFEARPGHVTVLLGADGAGKTTALRLMLQLRPGRGVALFEGRPLDHMAHPSREVGVLLGDVPGHPARTVGNHLRMLAAAAGVPTERADEVLGAVGLGGLTEQRLGSLSRGMDRRLGLAAALIGDPHTLVLDEPTKGLSSRETAWVHGLIRDHAAGSGTVLVALDDPKEAARLADRVVTLDGGRVVADQPVAEFARTRLRPRVAVRSPHAARLSALLTDEIHSGNPAVEVVREGGSRISVYGSTCADVGEVAFRHGILVHQLADEVGDMGPSAVPHEPDGGPASAAAGHLLDDATIPIPRLSPPGPVWPVRYELRRAGGVRTGWLAAAAALVTALLVALPLARAGDTSAARLLTGWPEELPLPPAAFGAGLLGALAFGQEFRYPALAHGHSPVPRRLGLLAAKLLVCTAVATVLGAVSVAVNGLVLRLVFGPGAVGLPPDWPVAALGWTGLVMGCAWAGLLAAGLFRSTLMGLVAVLSVPMLVVPAVQHLLERPAAHAFQGLSGLFRAGSLVQWPSGVDPWVSGAVRLGSQPVGQALALSLGALLCAYLVVVLRGRTRWWP
ncbi:ABC transporter ATP-binding protein [Streptomyces sp. NPDC002055]|uniref:ABC transporter ATP-binding protein n=1 Tax=Streptomyces sp. NPDC002055 TaxID=3154534 RepID=UPI00332CF127